VVQKAPLIETPAFQFGPQEYEGLASFVPLGVFFLWDVLVDGKHTHPLLFDSHDEVGWVEA